MRLGIDIDGVLTDFEGYFTEESSRYQFIHNLPVYFKPVYDLDISSGMKAGSLEYKEYLSAVLHSYFIGCNVRRYASEVIKKLRLLGHEIIIITKRHSSYCDDETGKKEVIKFLEKNDIEYDDIVFASHSSNKRVECESLDLDVMLDDNPYVVEDLRGSSVKMVVYHATYNYDYKDVDRVYSWYEFLDYIMKLEK